LSIGLIKETSSLNQDGVRSLKTKAIFAILASIASIIGVGVGIHFGVEEAKLKAEPTSDNSVQLTMETDFSNSKSAPGPAPLLEVQTCGGVQIESSLKDLKNKRVYSFNGEAEDLFMKFTASNNDGWQVKGLHLQKCKADVCIEEEVLATKERTFKPFWIDGNCETDASGRGQLPCFKEFVLKKSDEKWYITSNLNDNNCE